MQRLLRYHNSHTCKQTTHPQACVRHFGPEQHVVLARDDFIEDFQIKGPSKILYSSKKIRRFRRCVRKS